MSLLRHFRRSCARSFDRSARGIEVARALSVLHQGEQSVSSYSIKFHMLAVSCGCNKKALWDHFLHGLAEQVKDEIYSLELPAGLDSTSLSGSTTGLLSVPGTEEGDFPTSASRAPSQ